MAVFYILAPDENALIQCDLLLSEKNISPSVYCTCQLLVFWLECKAKRCLWMGNWSETDFFFLAHLSFWLNLLLHILFKKKKNQRCCFLSSISLCSFLSSWIWNNVNKNGAVFPAAQLPQESFSVFSPSHWGTRAPTTTAASPSPPLSVFSLCAAGILGNWQEGFWFRTKAGPWIHLWRCALLVW